MRADRILSLLPDVVTRAAPAGSIIDGLVEVMADHHQPVEDLLHDFGRYVDPYRCPAAFVPLLACWVGFDWLVEQPADSALASRRPPVSESALRHLVFHAADLAKQRGTALGVRRTLELATGRPGFEVVPLATPAFSFLVRSPTPARPVLALVAHIVDHEKPAFTTAAIAVGPDEPVPLTDLVDDPSSATPRPSAPPASATATPPTTTAVDQTKGDPT